MYITAQRVQEPGSKTLAVHAFVHMHNSDELFRSGKKDIEIIRQVTEVEPGQLVEKDVTLRTGGNLVLSYVDVIAPDSTPPSHILDALAGFRSHVVGVAAPNYARYQDVLISFGAVFGLEGAELMEYDQLRDSMERIINRFYASRDE